MAEYKAVQKERHSSLRWTRPTSFAFANSESCIPIAGIELPRALLTMPIAFLKVEERYLLVAVTSLVSGRNMFIGPSGEWLLGYTPASIRCYPFKLLRPGEHSDPILCVDEESGLATGVEGLPYFNEAGEIGNELRELLNFLSQYHQSLSATDLAVGSLAAAGLIAPWTIKVQTDAGSREVTGLYNINEQALNELAEDQFSKIRATGGLALAYGQLFSMGQISVFQSLARLQQQLAPKPTTPLPATLDRLFDQDDNGYLKFD